MITGNGMARILISEVNKLHGCTVSELNQALEKDGHHCNENAVTETLQGLIMQGSLYVDERNRIQTNTSH